MKSVYACLVVFLVTIALPGCGGSAENTIATEGATVDDIAQYEADLAAANAEGTYADDDGEGDGDEGDGDGE